MSSIYIEEYKRVACQAFSMWNRDPASPSFGSFDRQYWGWKKKDFSDSTLQYAIKLTIEYARLCSLTSTIPSLIEGYIDFCEKIQLRDGSFDQCYPNERTPGVIYDILSTLIYVRKSPYLHSNEKQGRLDQIIERAVAFALKTDEKHGNIANHIAEYAYELFNYASYTSDNEAHSRGQEYLERLLSLFDFKEGWFREYEGPDAGYQTRTLRYLCKCAEILNSDELWGVMKKAADFESNLLMPDGSIHPMLGCRSTALLYPSAFEVLATKFNQYQGLAARVRYGWANMKVPLPSWLDFDNAIRLADDARDAANALSVNPDTIDGSAIDSVMHLDDRKINLVNAGILINRSSDLAVYTGYRLGGVVVAYKKNTNNDWRLIFEDSGYMIHSKDGKILWISRMPGSGVLEENNDESSHVRAEFYRSLHDEVTPGRLMLLRLLNMTVLRFQWAADLFRKVIVDRIMTRREKLPVQLSREIKIMTDNIRIVDRLEDNRKNGDISGKGKLYRCRRLTGSHMASARYFQPQELEKMYTNLIEEIPWSGHETRYQIEIPLKDRCHDR